MTNKKMILDLDTGVDDALALAYAVAEPSIDLIGIISSYGNTLVDTSGQNSLDLLHLLKQEDVPVFIGESHSSTTDSFETMQISKDIHGNNGIGEVELEKAIRPIETQSGVDFLIEAAHQYGEDLIFLPTGPLTNLAAAIKKDPEVANLIGNTTLMGGALTVEGNVTPYAEANINQDPQAADTVFKKQKNLTMIGLDVTLRTLLTKNETGQWRKLGVVGEKFADITDFYIDAYYNLGIDKKGCALHDPLAVGVSVDSSFVSLIDLNMKVMSDETYWGRTIGDKDRLLEATTTKVAVDVDHQRYLEYFMKLLNELFEQVAN